MISTQTMTDYPVFAESGSKSEPDSTTYSEGFEPADVLPAQWVNWIENRTSSAITTLNSGVKSMEEELNAVVEAGGQTPSASDSSQVLSGIKYLINKAQTTNKSYIDTNTKAIESNANSIQTNSDNISTNTSDISKIKSALTSRDTSTSSLFYQLMQLVHPVGSLYWSSNSTSPATLFGGTWEQIKDKFIYAAGTYSAGTTDGASTVTLTTDNLPNHSHKLTNGTAKFTGTSGTTSSSGAHTHTSYYYRGNTKSGGFWATGDTVMYNPYDARSTTSSAGAHTHTFTPSGSISGQTDSTGSGTSFSIMPPYLVMYCWKRTA